MTQTETCFNYCDGVAYFSSDERKWINKIHKLKEQHPDEVEILAEPETNDGCIYCKLPTHTLKIQFKREVSDEARKLAAERMAEMRKNGLI